jgi:hypothetical protein
MNPTQQRSTFDFVRDGGTRTHDPFCFSAGSQSSLQPGRPAGQRGPVGAPPDLRSLQPEDLREPDVQPGEGVERDLGQPARPGVGQRAQRPAVGGESHLSDQSYK